jgi:hypothetical protein
MIHIAFIPIAIQFQQLNIVIKLGGGGIADYGVDYEIRRVTVNSSIGSHTPCFSFNTVSGKIIFSVQS